MIKKFINEPLLHFLLIGAVFFILYSVVEPENSQDKRIVVDDGRINHLSAMFEKIWNREPSSQELKQIIKDYVLEEVYYREALQLGIDKNDAMIRRRLRQKMEFFTSAAVSMVEPENAELEQYLQKNADKYKTDNQYSFEHIFVSTDRSPTDLAAKIKEVQLALQQEQLPISDPSLLPKIVSNSSAFKLERTFGNHFSKKLDSLELNDWSEPFRSGLGLHFVKLTKRQAGTLPPLEEVRKQVTRDWMHQKSQTLRSEVERNLLDEYEVIVNWTADSEITFTKSR